jgi:hypothetical protein
MQAQHLDLLQRELGELGMTCGQMIEARLNSQVYLIERESSQPFYAEIFHKNTCFRSFIGSRILMKHKRILTRLNSQHEMPLALPSPLDTRNFYLLVWKPPEVGENRVNLYEYLIETELSYDDKWNVIYEIYRSVWGLARKGIYLKNLPFERIFVQGKLILLDAFEFMDFSDAFDPQLEESINHVLLERYANSSNFSIIAPEVFLSRRLTSKSSCWVLGNIIFYIFEVR